MEGRLLLSFVHLSTFILWSLLFTYFLFISVHSLYLSKPSNALNTINVTHHSLLERLFHCKTRLWVFYTPSFSMCTFSFYFQDSYYLGTTSGVFRPLVTLVSTHWLLISPSSASVPQPLPSSGMLLNPKMSFPLFFDVYKNWNRLQGTEKSSHVRGTWDIPPIWSPTIPLSVPLNSSPWRW